MIIYGYAMTMPDDVDTLPDALTSMALFCDRIYLVDGGMGGGTLCHHPRYTASIKEWLPTRPEFSGYGAGFFTLDSLPWSDEEVEAFKKALGEHPVDDSRIVVAADMTLEISGVKWSGVPLTVWDNEFKDPAHQRNFTLSKMLEESDQPDWIYWHDSDEIASWELIKGVRPFLESLPSDVTNITVKWLTLVQDEQHCVKHMSDWLAHSRIHRPNTVTWGGNWHEHGNFSGRRESWDGVRVIHTRALFTNRLKIQRGHDGIASGQTPLWADAEMIPVPDGATWGGLLHWPEGEHPTPFR